MQPYLNVHELLTSLNFIIFHVCNFHDFYICQYLISCVTHASCIVFDDVVYSMKPILGPGFIFVIISRWYKHPQAGPPVLANSTNAILSQL